MLIVKLKVIAFYSSETIEVMTDSVNRLSEEKYQRSIRHKNAMEEHKTEQEDAMQGEKIIFEESFGCSKLEQLATDIKTIHEDRGINRIYHKLHEYYSQTRYKEHGMIAEYCVPDVGCRVEFEFSDTQGNLIETIRSSAILIEGKYFDPHCTNFDELEGNTLNLNALLHELETGELKAKCEKLFSNETVDAVSARLNKLEVNNNHKLDLS